MTTCLEANTKNPSPSIREEVSNCPHTTIIPGRDFAQLDQKITHEPTISAIAACGVIMFNNNNKISEWLKDKSTNQLERLVRVARTNKYDGIKSIRNVRRLYFNLNLTMWTKKSEKKK